MVDAARKAREEAQYLQWVQKYGPEIKQGGQFAVSTMFQLAKTVMTKDKGNVADLMKHFRPLMSPEDLKRFEEVMAYWLEKEREEGEDATEVEEPNIPISELLPKYHARPWYLDMWDGIKKAVRKERP